MEGIQKEYLKGVIKKGEKLAGKDRNKLQEIIKELKSYNEVEGEKSPKPMHPLEPFFVFHNDNTVTTYVCQAKLNDTLLYIDEKKLENKDVKF